MSTFTLVHELRCASDAFWELFFDHDFNLAVYLKTLEFPKFEVLQLDSDERELRRRVNAVPKMDAPAPVQKLIGPSLSYIEEGTFDRSAKVWRWRIIPSSLAEKVKTEGLVRIESLGPDSCKRIVDFNCQANVFGLGGLIESALEKNLRAAWNLSAEFTNEWLRGRRP